MSAFTRIRTDALRPFYCERCRVHKSTRHTIRWASPDGDKVICLGCYSELIAKGRK